MYVVSSGSHVHLVVGVPDSLLRSRWRAMLGDIAEVEICPLNQLGLRNRTDVQCLVVTNRELDELWGGEVVPDGVGCRTTERYYGYEERPVSMPAYVVSTLAVSSLPTGFVPVDSVERWLSLALARIDHENSFNITPRISKLAVLGELIATDDVDLELRLKRLREAYLAYLRR
jgi:hypothetical protein